MSPEEFVPMNSPKEEVSFLSSVEIKQENKVELLEDQENKQSWITRRSGDQSWITRK